MNVNTSPRASSNSCRKLGKNRTEEKISINSVWPQQKWLYRMKRPYCSYCSANARNRTHNATWRRLDKYRLIRCTILQAELHSHSVASAAFECARSGHSAPRLLLLSRWNGHVLGGGWWFRGSAKAHMRTPFACRLLQSLQFGWMWKLFRWHSVRLFVDTVAKVRFSTVADCNQCVD